MGRNITDYTNYIAPDSTYPYGDIKDNPGDGTGTRVSRTTNADMQQFFQRIAANAGVFLNGTPDNADNGFQYVEALNTLINQQTAGMAGAAGASGLVPVIMSGMVVHSGPTSTIDPGWFFYDGQYCFFEGGGYASIPGGDVRLITITYIDGFPNATLSLDTPVSDSTHFDFSNAISWEQAVGIKLFGWTTIPTGTGWTGVDFQYNKDAKGRIYLRGGALAGGTATTLVGTLPTGARPVNNMNVVVTNLISGVNGVGIVSIGADGKIHLLSPSSVSTSDVWEIDSITFLNS